MNTSTIFRISGILFFICLLLSSCKKDCFAVKGKGAIESKVYTVPSFNAVSNSISAVVYLTSDSIQSVRVEAQSNIHEILSFKVLNNELQIGYINNCGSIKHDDIKIYISIPTVTALRLSGSGDMVTTNEFQTAFLDATISGSGSITAAVQSSAFVNGQISGSGNLIISGNTSAESFKISGSGNIRSFALQSLNSVIEISGSGNADVNIENQLSVSISGSGDVRYKGNPSVSSNISGSGNITQVP
ncbi:MAG: head GIN domain-containing protein [Bacteroidia bacterium]